MSKCEVGMRIREMRKRKHYTREALAGRVGISTKFLYEIETGRKNFSADVLCRIAQELDVSCDYIMLGEKEEHQHHEAAQFLKKLDALGPEKLERLQRILEVLEEVNDRV